MKLSQRFRGSAFSRVFHFRTESSRILCYALINVALANIGSAIITGALYAAFLAENGIDIVRVGIISLIPYISWAMSVFSPMVLSKIKRRQRAMFFSDLTHYTCVVLATTIMPLLVKDPNTKTLLFGIFLFIGHSVNAVIGNGYSGWMAQFVPKGPELNIYTSYINLTTTFFSTVSGILASVAATALAARGEQFWFLFWLRIGAFVLFMTGVTLVFLVPREIPLPCKKPNINPVHVITEPIKYRRFVMAAMIPVLWNLCSGVNGGTYTYYLLQTVRIPMWYTYIGSVVCVLSNLFLLGLFRKLAARISPYWMVGGFWAFFTVLEVLYFLVAPGNGWLYALLAALSGLGLSGFNLGYTSLFYLSLPQHDSSNDLFATFWNLVANLAAFAGTALGTALLSRLEAHGTYQILGMSLYGSQILCAAKFCLYTLSLVYLVWIIPKLRAPVGAKED